MRGMADSVWPSAMSESWSVGSMRNSSRDKSVNISGTARMRRAMKSVNPKIAAL